MELCEVQKIEQHSCNAAFRAEKEHLDDISGYIYCTVNCQQINQLQTFIRDK